MLFGSAQFYKHFGIIYKRKINTVLNYTVHLNTGHVLLGKSVDKIKNEKDLSFLKSVN